MKEKEVFLLCKRFPDPGVAAETQSGANCPQRQPHRPYLLSCLGTTASILDQEHCGDQQVGHKAQYDETIIDLRLHFQRRRKESPLEPLDGFMKK